MTIEERLAAMTAIKGADYARRMIDETARKTPNTAARLAMARAAAGPHGNYTDEAKALWAAYAAEGAPRRK